VTRPKLLLMDEPTEGIQPNIIQLIGSVIRQLRDEGEMAIVLVEQYFDFAFDLADRFYVLSRGRTVFQAEKAQTTRNQVQEAFSLQG
jgi:urea transport system ATP-binding protein